MAERTPTSRGVRALYVANPPVPRVEFDRWLAEHDRAVRVAACEHLQHLRGHDIEQEYINAVIEGGAAEASDNEAELRYIQRVRSMLPSPAAVRMLDEHEAEVRGRIEAEGGGR